MEDYVFIILPQMQNGKPFINTIIRIFLIKLKLRPKILKHIIMMINLWKRKNILERL